MKRDLKPFVVEVKRGTRRSSFLGNMDQTSAMTEAQRRAEAVLFAPAIEEAAPKATASETSRRILPSLIEPPPSLQPEREDIALASEERRPRPVGRPRKPKLPAEAAQDRVMAATARPLPQPAFSEAVVGESSPSYSANAQESPSAEPPTASAGDRTRLRDRSAILARYVLGTRPAPGERWTLTSRRLARRARHGAE